MRRIETTSPETSIIPMLVQFEFQHHHLVKSQKLNQPPGAFVRGVVGVPASAGQRHPHTRRAKQANGRTRGAAVVGSSFRVRRPAKAGTPTPTQTTRPRRTLGARTRCCGSWFFIFGTAGRLKPVLQLTHTRRAKLKFGCYMKTRLVHYCTTHTHEVPS
jgi:hypothetical protein